MKYSFESALNIGDKVRVVDNRKSRKYLTAIGAEKEIGKCFIVRDIVYSVEVGLAYRCIGTNTVFLDDMLRKEDKVSALELFELIRQVGSEIIEMSEGEDDD